MWGPGQVKKSDLVLRLWDPPPQGFQEETVGVWEQNQIERAAGPSLHWEGGGGHWGAAGLLEW